MKCWSSGKKSRLIIKSVSGQAFINFSAFLVGHPKYDHSKPRRGHRIVNRNLERNPNRRSSVRKKREMALTTSPVSSPLPASGHPKVPTTSSPTQVEASSTSFYFSTPLPENFRESSSSETMMHTSLYFSRVEEERGQNENKKIFIPTF